MKSAEYCADAVMGSRADVLGGSAENDEVWPGGKDVVDDDSSSAVVG